MTVELNGAKPSAFSHIKAPNWSAQGVAEGKPAAKTFHDFFLGPELCRALDDVKYKTPTPVQAACLPLVLAGLDLIIQSQTGTGKTAAFAIPTLEMLEPGTKKVEALILAPTRELAQQIKVEFDRLGVHKQIPVACVYGGTGFQQQYDELEDAQIVCATPGRLLDLVNRKALSLEHLKIFILDEADEMLNMGFEKELDAIVELLPETRQSLLFSATVGEDIKRISSHILTWPEFVSISGDNIAAREVEHVYYMVTGLGRLWDLNRVIDVEQPESAIIFCNTRDDSFLVSNFLRKQGYVADVLNGDLPQKEREQTLGRLRRGELRFLVATDVAARGIDISDLSHVLNFSLPDSPETYVHRTGRTGRAGRSGVAISLISPREIGTYYFLRRVYKMHLVERVLPSAEEILRLKTERAAEALVAQLQGDASLDAAEALPLAALVLASPDAPQLVARLLTAYQRQATAAPPVDPDLVIDEAALRARPAAINGAAAPARPSAAAAPAAAPAPKAAPAPREAIRAPEVIVAEALAAEEAAEEIVEEIVAVAAAAIAEVEEEEEAALPPLIAEAEERGEDDGGRRRRRRRRGGRRGERGEAGVDDNLDDLEIALVDEDAPPARVEPAPAPKKAAPAPRKPAPVHEEPEVASADEQEEVLRRIHAPKEMVRLHINVGSQKLETEADLLKELCELAGMDPEDFGEVTLRRRFCYVEVREDMVDDVIEAVKGHQYDGVTLKAAPALGR
jgi:ATP-dependent RNA helicase DeaD